MPINYKLYPSDWKTRIVPLVRARSKDRCEFCGVKNGEQCASIVRVKKKMGKTIYRKKWIALNELQPYTPHKVVKVFLTVAHLDHDSHNNLVQLDRLRHLCQRCHLIYDSFTKAKKKKDRLSTGNPQG